MTSECLEILVSGRVQGVSFRASTAQQAERLGLTGSVRNLPDGRVEILAQGDPGPLNDLLNWARRGPRAARVDQLESRAVPCDPSLKAFSIRD